MIYYLLTKKNFIPIYHQWIDYVRTEILPQKTYQKDLLYYDLQCTHTRLFSFYDENDENY